MKSLLIATLLLTSTSIFSTEKLEVKKPILDSLDDQMLNIDSRRLRLMRSGGWSGNGGDFNQVSDNIWFLGNESISYCIKSSEDFVLDNSQLNSLIIQSISKWKQFFSKYKLTGVLSESLPNRKVQISFIDGIERGANFNFKYQKACKNTELTFYFGTENKHIKDYKKFATEHPFGLALRKSYNHKTYLNEGLIWIKNLKDTSKIKHTLLHELGHVFGMEHDSVYVMSSDMALNLDSMINSEYFGEVESQSWPYRFTEETSLNLGIKRKNNQRFSKCAGKQEFVARKLSKYFSMFFDVKPMDCLSVKLRSYGETKNKGVKLELKIENTSQNKEVVLQGRFPNKRRSLKKKAGPGVFTQYLVKKPRKEKLVWRKLSLDKYEHQELSGVFSFKGVSIPSKLTQEKGAILDLFIQKNEKWITLKSY